MQARARSAASSKTKNPDYRDVLYSEELIGPDTVNTMPLSTVKAFGDHGNRPPPHPAGGSGPGKAAVVGSDPGRHRRGGGRRAARSGASKARRQLPAGPGHHPSQPHRDDQAPLTGRRTGSRGHRSQGRANLATGQACQGSGPGPALGTADFDQRRAGSFVGFSLQNSSEFVASRCYLIQMLRSALPCTNGCSCWSLDEKNSPQIFLTIHAVDTSRWRPHVRGP